MQRGMSLNGIRVFVVAARLGSFQDAAQKLCVTPGAISRQIQALEQQLAVQLFARLPRKIDLTAAGKTLLEQVGPALATIDEACLQLSGTSRQAILRLESTPTFAMHWLLPRLPQFHATYPQVQVELRTTQGLIDRSHPAHLFIRRCPDQFAGLEGTQFMQEYSMLVSCPDYLARNQVKDAASVASSRKIAMRSRRDLWPKWLEAHSLDTSQTDTQMELDNTILAIQAAVQGLGIAFIPVLFLTDALTSGTLVPIPGFGLLQTGSYHWLSQQVSLSSASKTFIDWLSSTARQCQQETDTLLNLRYEH